MVLKSHIKCYTLMTGTMDWGQSTCSMCPWARYLTQSCSWLYGRQTVCECLLMLASLSRWSGMSVFASSWKGFIDWKKYHINAGYLQFKLNNNFPNFVFSFHSIRDAFLFYSLLWSVAFWMSFVGPYFYLKKNSLASAKYYVSPQKELFVNLWQFQWSVKNDCKRNNLFSPSVVVNMLFICCY